MLKRNNYNQIERKMHTFLAGAKKIQLIRIIIKLEKDNYIQFVYETNKDRYAPN